MVGAVRFELTTSCTRNTRATRLRYAPNQEEQGAAYRKQLQCSICKSRLVVFPIPKGLCLKAQGCDEGAFAKRTVYLLFCFSLGKGSEGVLTPTGLRPTW